MSVLKIKIFLLPSLLNMIIGSLGWWVSGWWSISRRSIGWWSVDFVKAKEVVVKAIKNIFLYRLVVF